jgi:putrescine transport system substrate-binding protein
MRDLRLKHVVAGVGVALMGLSALAATSASKSESKLNVYNWSDFIAKDTVSNFEKRHNTHVEYDNYDSDDILQAKLLVGRSGYDIVVPSSSYMAKQIQAGVYQKLDKSKLPNLANLDPVLMKMLDNADPGGQYGVPWAYAATGIGYNVQAVKKALGANAPTNSWALVFDPANLAKLKTCGVSFLDSPSSMFPAVLQYIHKDPNSTNPADYQAALEVLKKVRPYVTRFNSSGYINDLANNDVCVAVGWSGDVGIARRRAQEAKRPYDIKYVNVKEGGFMWFDVMGIPKDAPHPEAALKWMNYILEPKVSAAITSEVYYPTANRAARQFLPAAVANDPTVFPPEAELKKMVVMKAMPPNIQRLQSRLWEQMKTGH